MVVASISDLHGNLIPYPSWYWRELDQCEILLICGDIIPLDIQHNIPKSKEWLLNDFKQWCKSLPVEKIFFIAGNHDYVAERCKKDLLHWFPNSYKITYLHNTGVEYISSEGVYTIFGTPYCKQFGNWAFMRNDDILKEKFSEIPENLSILITHDPPSLGTVGTILQQNNWNFGINAGNNILSDVILEKKPKNVFSGHIHSGNHNIECVEGINIVNCSIVDEKYDIVYEPIIHYIV